LKYAGIAGSYDLFPVQPGDTQALKALLEQMRSGGIDGLNVTIPHKRLSFH
jgi:shikimate 5-dehydrogenase